MLPALVGGDCLDLAYGKQVAASDAPDRLAEKMRSPYGANIVLGQSGAMMFNADGPPLSVPGHLIAHVVKVCSEVEVGRITAKPVITMVQDMQSIRNRAPCQLKRPSMCSLDDFAAVPPSISKTMSARRTSGSGPIPAFVNGPALDAGAERFCEFAVSVLSHFNESTTAVTTEV